MDSSNERMPVIAPRPKQLGERRLSERREEEPALFMDLLRFPRDQEKDRRGKERRATPRVQVELECEERSGTSRYFHVTWDLSTFGLSTRYGYPHELGTRLSVFLHLPNEPSNPVEVTGEVVGRNAESGGVRIAFRNAPIDSLRKIHRFLSRRTQTP